MRIFGSFLYDLCALLLVLTLVTAVVEEVRKAPQRRLDNLLTGLYDAAAQLEMHGRIVKDVQTRFSKLYWQSKRQEIGVALTGGGLAAAFGALSFYGTLPVPATVTGSVLDRLGDGRHVVVPRSSIGRMGTTGVSTRGIVSRLSTGLRSASK